VRDTLFVLGAERSEGTCELVDRLARAVPGVVARRLDAEVIPPLSDYWPFQERRVPFLFLTCGRWRHYHTPQDTPDRLAYGKIAATARWLEALVRAACARPEPRVRFTGARDDGSTLRTFVELLAAVPGREPARRQAEALLAACDGAGRSPTPDAIRGLAMQIEAALA
jgi:hypothetical protein